MALKIFFEQPLVVYLQGGVIATYFHKWCVDDQATHTPQPWCACI